MTALYWEDALGLTRLAFLVLGDRPAAEDVVQDAFCGLYRAWDRLPAAAGRQRPAGSGLLAGSARYAGRQSASQDVSAVPPHMAW